MEELSKVLTKIELTADDVLDTKQQIVNLDAKRHKTREALNLLKEDREKYKNLANRKCWVCVGDMFIRLNHNDTRNIIVDEQYSIDQGVEKLRDQLSEKVHLLRELEGKPELAEFNLKPLSKKEILALRTGFRI